MIAALASGAGYGPDDVVLVAVHHGRTPTFVAQGTTGPDTRVYVASLSKQFTAACVALLARSGQLDVEQPLAEWLPELPSWAGAVRLRHLVHHTGGLPADAEVDARAGAARDRTTDGVLAALCGFPSPQGPPGTVFAYSNAGYVCLALAASRAAAVPLPHLAQRYLFEPLGMRATLFWPGPGAAPPAGAPLRPAPLSLGDGGAWSTASDLLRWSHALNADELGISALLQTPGRLDDGRPLDYAWGIGVRTHAGHPTYRHGGGWPGIRLLLARVPDRGLGVLVIDRGDHTDRGPDTDRHVALTDALLTLFTDP